MKGMQDWRRAASFGLFAALALAGSGCGKSSDQPGKSNVKVASGKKDDGKGSKTPSPMGPTAPEFLGAFLKSIKEGTAKPDVLTPAFRARIARPNPKDETEAKLGYSPIAVDAFFTRAARGEFGDGFVIGSTLGSEVVFWGTVKPTAGVNERFVVRLAASNGGWQVDWFHRSSATGSDYSKFDTKALGAEIAAAAFLDNLAAGDLALAETLLARAWKVKEYGSNAPSDVELGYNHSLVMQRLRGWKGAAADYQVAKRVFPSGPGQPYHYEGDLLNAAKVPIRTYRMTVARDDSGGWFVTQFEVE